jgi:outer membrane lipoprotein-sorting protein
MPIVLVAAVVASLGASALAAPLDFIPVPVPAPLPKTTMATTAAPQPSTPLALAPMAQPLPDPVMRSAKPPMTMVAGPGGAVAFDAKQRTLIERVNAYLTSVQTLVGDFVQVSSNGRTEGKFYIQKPGRVRFEYDPPSPIELVADGSSLVVRDRRLATQDLYPLSQTPLRFLLADRIDLLRDTDVISVTADEMFVTLVIEEKQLVGGSHRMMLMFGAQDFQLRQWTITDPQGFDTTVAIYNLDNSKKLDPDLFKITYQRNFQ